MRASVSCRFEGEGCSVSWEDGELSATGLSDEDRVRVLAVLRTPRSDYTLRDGVLDGGNPVLFDGKSNTVDEFRYALLCASGDDLITDWGSYQEN